MKYSPLFATALLLILLPFVSNAQTNRWNKNAIQPYSVNQGYWQYKKKPVLLVGASDNDNIFQMNHFHSHLDSLADIGGNYIRCTMSDRDEGNMRAFARRPDGQYDLKQWNPAYWNQFEDMLKTAQSLHIIVQIEIWDRFDHSRKEWLSDPWNPANNINYNFTEVNLAAEYPKHPGSNEQPFFYTVPSLNNNKTLLAYQQSFVNKLLSITLQYNNVLYCIDNETAGDPKWGSYWAQYIHEKAGNKKVCITEMWDDWNVSDDRHKETIDHPELYDFIDLSQNSQTTGHDNWVNPQKNFEYIRSDKRPVNNVKIYGGPWNPHYVKQGKDADHAVQTFFKNIIGGFASSRFHRPPTGLGLSERSIYAIKTIRAIESKIHFWDLSPGMNLLSDLEEGEAYIAADEGRGYVVYFPAAGEVTIHISNVKKPLTGAWISTRDAMWKKAEKVSSKPLINLQPPDETGWIYVIY